MQVEWNPCSEGLPPVDDQQYWIANYEQLWGLATLTDGTDCHSEAYWWLEAQQESLAQMFVTYWAEVDYPDLPIRQTASNEVKQWPSR